MQEKKIQMRIIREEVQDLDKIYGIDVEEELAKILQIELSKVLEINEENLKSDDWVLGMSPSTGKTVWLKIIFDEDKLPPLKVYEYDPETKKIRINKEELSVCNMSDLKMFILILGEK